VYVCRRGKAEASSSIQKKEQLGDGTKWYHQILYESIGLDISDKVG